MNKKFVLGVIAVLVVAVGAFFVLNNARVQTAAPTHLTELTSTNFQTTLANSKVPVYVLVTADNCQKCDQMEAMLEHSATKFSGQMAFYKINVTKNPDVAKGVTPDKLPISVIIDPATGAQAGPFGGVAPGQSQLDGVIQKVLDQIKQIKAQPQQPGQGDPTNGAPAQPAQPQN